MENASSVIQGHVSSKYKYYERCIQQCESEMEWDVILSSRTVRIVVYEKAEHSSKLRELWLCMLPNKMAIYFSTLSFLGVWDYSCCLFPISNNNNKIQKRKKARNFSPVLLKRAGAAEMRQIAQTRRTVFASVFSIKICITGLFIGLLKHH